MQLRTADGDLRERSTRIQYNSSSYAWATPDEIVNNVSQSSANCPQLYLHWVAGARWRLWQVAVLGEVERRPTFERWLSYPASACGRRKTLNMRFVNFEMLITYGSIVYELLLFHFYSVRFLWWIIMLCLCFSTTFLGSKICILAKYSSVV